MNQDITNVNVIAFVANDKADASLGDRRTPDSEPASPASPDGRSRVLYSVEDTPPPHLCLVLGFQVRRFHIW